jgi:cell division protein FtsQ
MRKYNWKKILIRTVWVIAGIGTIVLLGAAMQKKNQKRCADIKIELTGVDRHMFIDEKDVLDILNAAGAVAGNKLSELNLRAMETVVERNPWVKNAEMFLDNNHFLQVKIEERQPVARVFTLGGSSFYLDSGSMRLPLSEKLSARVPIFTGFPSDKKILAGPDSALLKNIVRLGQYIMADSFWMAQVAQVAITPQSNFELVPVIGDHLVALGNADELDSKFKRLYTFYRKAWLQNGINTYERLDVQYHNQVVAVQKGTTKAKVDSARSLEIIQGLLAQAEAGLFDSLSAKEILKTDIPKPPKDSGRIIKPAMLLIRSGIHPIIKTNSTTVANNNTNTKTLSNGKKQKSEDKKQFIQKPATSVGQPKAVMKRN